MFCNKCGNKLSGNERFCNKCGNKIIYRNERIIDYSRESQTQSKIPMALILGDYYL